MKILSIVLILLIGGTFIVCAAATGFARRYESRWARILASVLLAVGGTGFFGSALSAVGGINWLPRSFEWPVGYVGGIVSMRDGTYVVPHPPMGAGAGLRSRLAVPAGVARGRRRGDVLADAAGVRPNRGPHGATRLAVHVHVGRRLGCAREVRPRGQPARS